jgi:HEAT repeat protein
LCAGETVGLSLLSDKNLLVRAQAAEWATDHPRPEVVSRLLELLSDPESLCRFYVEDSLLRMGTIVVGRLAEYLNTHSGREVEDALKVCVGVPSPQFLDPALSLVKHESPAVRVLAAKLLGSIGGDQAVNALRKLLKDINAEVRATAASALGRLHYWPASSELADMLGDSDWHVRRNAGYALRAVGPPGILVLRQSMNSKNELAAEMARAALEFSDITTKDEFT